MKNKGTLGIKINSKEILWRLYRCVPGDTLEKFSPLSSIRSKDYEIQVDVETSDGVRSSGEVERPFIKKVY